MEMAKVRGRTRWLSAAVGSAALLALAANPGCALRSHTAVVAPPLASHATRPTPPSLPIEQPAPSRADAPCGWMPAPPATYQHVITIWMENKRWANVFGDGANAPYEKGLAAGCGTATNWRDAGSAYDSEPNYIAYSTGIAKAKILERFVCDCPPTVPRGNYVTGDNLFRQVRTAGGTERSYQENMQTNCQETDGGKYAVKHNPDAFMGSVVNGTFVPDGSCATDDVATGSYLLYQADSPLAQDLANDTLPTFSFVTPNMCNDTHNCSVAAGDAYLSKLVPLILDSQAYRSGTTALIVMWDEDTPIPNLVIAPSVQPGTVVTSRVSHYGALRATEEMLGLPLLRAAATTGAEDLRLTFGI
jgi:phospholipase C